jgi:hypothetical protein
MGTVKLSTPRLRVVLHEDDNDAIDVQTINADLVLAELTGRKHKWGALAESPLTYSTFLAWAALRRRRLIDPAVTFEAFSTTCASIETVDDDDEEADTRPTGPDPVSG